MSRIACRLKFTLRAMFLALTAICVCIGIFANGRIRQSRAVAAIKAIGGSIDYDCDFPADDEVVAGTGYAVRRWFGRLLGEELVRVVVSVGLYATDAERPCTDRELECLGGFPYLYVLSVDSPNVTDASVPRICELKRLTILHLEWTNVSDQGVQKLCSLKSLRALGIGNRPFEDHTITDAALARLGELKSLEVLCLHGHGITDDAVPVLEKLESLQELYLFSTRITGAGVARLNSSLPKCMVVAGEE